MRIFPRVFVGFVVALAWSAGAGCSSGPIESMGAGGAVDPSTGDLPPPQDVAVSVSIGAGGFFIPPGVWAKHYGDAEDQRAAAVAVNADSGEIAVVGTAKGTIDFGNIPWKGSATDTDVVVAKISSEGQSLWSRRYGDSCDQHGGAVAQASSGSVLIAGDFCGTMDFGTTTVESKGAEVDLFVAVIDTLGEDVYSRRFGGKGAQIARAAAVDADGNAIIVGSYDQAFDDGSGELASAGLDDSFVIKLDPKGNLLWSLSFGGPESDIARAVAIDAKGNIVIGGSFGGSVDFGGGPLAASAGHSSGFVLEIDPDGKHLWSKAVGAESDADSVVNAVAISAKGTIAATGTFAGTADFGSGPMTSADAEDLFLAVMDGAGAPYWGRTFGGSKSQRGTGVAFGKDEEVVVSGTSDEIVDLVKLGLLSTMVSYPVDSLNPYMIFAIDFSAPGAPLSALALDSTSPMESVGVGFNQAPDPGIVLAGSFQQKLSNHFTTVNGAGGWDMFVVREP